MIAGEQIRSLFVGLQESESLEDTLSQALRLVCAATGAAAAGIAGADEPLAQGEWWVKHDPHSLLEQRTGCSGESGDSPADKAMASESDSAHAISRGARPVGNRCYIGRGMRLRCGSRTIGTLVLIAPRETNEAAIRAQLAPIDTVLATLMAAVSGVCAADGLLTYPAFRGRIASEIARAQRVRQEFSVLHVRVRLEGGAETPGCGDPAPVLGARKSIAAQVGAALASKLRKSDAVGLIGPDRIAVLLTATPPLGARVAQRRIQELLPSLGQDSARSQVGLAAGEFQINSFPGDAGDVEGLCQVGDWTRKFDSPTTLVGETVCQQAC